MKKVNLLSRAEMKKITGGVRPVCEASSCFVTIGNWPDGCPENFHCAEVPCADPLLTYNTCVFNVVLED